jgi:hypothetical protein
MNRRTFLTCLAVGITAIAFPILTNKPVKNKFLSWPGGERFIIYGLGVPVYVTNYIELPSYDKTTKTWTPITAKLWRLEESNDEELISGLKTAKTITIKTLSPIGAIIDVYEIELKNLNSTKIVYDIGYASHLVANFDVSSAKVIS